MIPSSLGVRPPWPGSEVELTLEERGVRIAPWGAKGVRWRRGFFRFHVEKFLVLFFRKWNM
jgi:hypothetical protein